MAVALDPYMTLDEIAEEIRMSHSFVLRQAKSGVLRAVKFGRYWRVRRSAFLEWDQGRDPNNDPNLRAAAAYGYR